MKYRNGRPGVCRFCVCCGQFQVLGACFGAAIAAVFYKALEKNT